MDDAVFSGVIELNYGTWVSVRGGVRNGAHLAMAEFFYVHRALSVTFVRAITRISHAENTPISAHKSAILPFIVEIAESTSIVCSDAVESL